jgi:hypothetical protein
MVDPDVLQCLSLLKSGLSRVGAGYFILKATYEPAGIVRERVFCYELYHQARLSMKRGDKLSLNGEIDKRGHYDFKKRHQKNPDFVFHTPGTHAGNTLVVEVKGTLASTAGIRKDICTLVRFVESYDYSAGVFVLYNHSFGELPVKCADGLHLIHGTTMYQPF